MPETSCPACDAVMEAADNFCRNCGESAAAARLPATRANASVILWRPQASPVVKGAAVMAAGTIGQFVMRRAISGLLGGGSRNGRKKRSVFPSRQNDGMVDEAQIITETVMMRRVRVRRPV